MSPDINTTFPEDGFGTDSGRTQQYVTDVFTIQVQVSRYRGYGLTYTGDDIGFIVVGRLHERHQNNKYN